MFGLLLSASLVASSAPLCPCGPSCPCCEGGSCRCTVSYTENSKKSTIEEWTERAESTSMDLVIRVGGMSLQGISLPDNYMCRSIDAVEGVDGPCVYVGHCQNGKISDWTRYRPQPTMPMPVPPLPWIGPRPIPMPVPMFMGMGMGMGMGGSCAGGCCR